MAKIVTITNPLTGQPAQVDQLDHTAQQIDDGLNIARGVSNPNLLDNWYFGNPVDQRGGYVVPPGVMTYSDQAMTVSAGATSRYFAVKQKTDSYAYFEGGTGNKYYFDPSKAVRGYTGAVYGIDRFKIYGGVTGNLIVKDGYIEVSLTGLYSSLMQVFEKGAIVEGTYTLSVLTTSGLYKWTFEASKTTPAASPVGWFGIQNGYSYFNYNTDGTSNLYLFDNASSETISVSVVAAKLELGTEQTLAHQDANGNWQMNELPRYEDTLARCQRYHFEFGPSHALIAYDAYGVNSPVVYFPVQMRTAPSIKVYSKAGTENAISYWNGGAYVEFTDFYLESNENFAVLRSNGKLTPGGIYTVGKLIASADLQGGPPWNLT